MEKEVQIRIRCVEDLRTEFKKVAADFGSYADAIRSFIEVYKEKPFLFKTKSRPRVKLL